MTATQYLSRAPRHQPNYTARRAVAAVIATVILIALAFAASTVASAVGDVGSRPAAAFDITASAGDAANISTHVAQPGDTLWSIAERYRGDVGRDRFVDALIGLNGGTTIQIGQAVRLP